MRHFRVFPALGALLFFIFCGAAFGQSVNGEYIDRADITVRFDKDGSLSIREELDYVKPRGITKRGIFGELPRRVKDGEVTYNKTYELTLATRNGKPEPVTSQSGNGTIVWRLGHQEVFLKDGVQKYVLEYNSDDWVFRFDDLDEVTWNVWGEYWPFPVKELTGRIILPEGATAKQVATYSGQYGRTENDIRITQNGNVIEFASTKPLRPKEAATVSIGVEKGVFDPLSTGERRARWWRANGALIGLGCLSPAILLFYLFNWSRVGRDPIKPPVFPRYEPPKNYSAAAAHRITKKGLHGDSALISTLLSLAIKGRVKIDVTKKDTVLTRLPAPSFKSVKLNLEESRLFKSIFGRHTDQIVLRKKTPNPQFHRANLSFQRHLNKKYSSEYRRLNGQYVVMGVVLSGAGVLAITTAFYMPRAYLIWALIGALIVLNLVFMFLMPAPTKKGAAITSEIEGFKLYLETAEKLRLNAAKIGTDQVPPMTVERYEAFLPYAVALDVEKPWTNHFEATLPAVSETYSPNYYSNYRGGGFRGGGARGISRDMMKSLSSGVSSAKPIQTSSSGGSSSGGGFSGGGGGGGGGSW